jgi:hypothetical protein
MTHGQVIRPPLFLHNITTWLGRHIYIYAGIHYLVSRICRHIWTLAGIWFICRPGRYSYMPARLNLGQPSQSQPLSSYLYSLLTLPGVIPPTMAHMSFLGVYPLCMHFGCFASYTSQNQCSVARNTFCTTLIRLCNKIVKMLAEQHW